MVRFRNHDSRDRIEKACVDAMTAVGAVVMLVSRATTYYGGAVLTRKGQPDAFVGYQGRTIPMEFKDPEHDASRSKECIALDRLDPAQCDWHARWTGSPTEVVTTADEAIRALGGRP